MPFKFIPNMKLQKYSVCVYRLGCNNTFFGWTIDHKNAYLSVFDKKKIFSIFEVLYLYATTERKIEINIECE